MDWSPPLFRRRLSDKYIISEFLSKIWIVCNIAWKFTIASDFNLSDRFTKTEPYTINKNKWNFRVRFTFEIACLVRPQDEGWSKTLTKSSPLFVPSQMLCFTQCFVRYQPIMWCFKNAKESSRLYSRFNKLSYILIKYS